MKSDDRLKMFQLWLIDEHTPAEISIIRATASDILDVVGPQPFDVLTMLGMTLAMAEYSTGLEVHGEDELGVRGDTAVDNIVSPRFYRVKGTNRSN